MKILKRLFTYVKPYLGWLFLGILAMLVVTGFQLSYPYILGEGLFDQVFKGRQFALLNIIALGMIGLIIIKGFFTFLQTYLMSFIGQRIVADLRKQVYVHLQKMSLAYHESHRVGESISRITSDVNLIQFSVNSLIDLIYQTFLIVGTLGAIFWMHWRLALLTIITFPLIFWVVAYAGDKIRAYSHRVQERIADLTSVLQESISGIRVVKAFAMEKYEIGRFSKANESSFKAVMKSNRAMSLLTPLVEILFVIGMALVIWYGGMEVLNGHLTEGKLLAFFGYIGLAMAPLTGVTHNLNLIQQSLAAAERIFAVLDEAPEIIDAPNAIELPRLQGKVEFSKLSFGYREGQPVLSEINLQVNPGEVIALVGPSGAGKTSLVNLIPRFYEPNSGQILLDGHEIRQVKIHSLRSQIGLVPQESMLFGVSIRENIAYGRPEASEAEIIAAAQAANAHQFIMELPEGYGTMVGERGASLSGGQRQRIAIARAILRNPRILILDEATSALDTESERLVQEALERLMHDRTTFVIAHRLSTIQHADKIVVLENGRIIEIGTHQELIGKGGLYQRLYEAGIQKQGISLTDKVEEV